MFEYILLPFYHKLSLLLAISNETPITATVFFEFVLPEITETAFFFNPRISAHAYMEFTSPFDALPSGP